VALEPPELEMRVAILLAKAALSGIRLDEQVAFFIAKHIRSNVRELEGALKRILAYSSFHGHEINLPMAKEALRDLLAVQNRQISVENIQKTVADYYKIRVSDMHSKKRFARRRAPAPGRHGARQGAHPAVAAGDRQQLRRARPHQPSSMRAARSRSCASRTPTSITTSISCCRFCAASRCASKTRSSGKLARHAADRAPLGALTVADGTRIAARNGRRRSVQRDRRTRQKRLHGTVLLPIDEAPDALDLAVKTARNNV
jgi:hypothetical protein